ncbi:transposase [candidate division KSB1 bacterium]|nr:transposase [candidate division KSB1 bacterium]
MGRTRYKIYRNEVPCFITSTVVNWLPLFTSRHIVEILLNSLKFLQEKERLTIYAYVIMENHLHLIASSAQLTKEIGIFRSYTARQIIDYLKARNAKNILRLLNFYKLKHKTDRDYQVWQEGIKPKEIINPQVMVQKTEYLHQNPVERGYVDDPLHWRYSSARNYAGMPGVMDVTLFSL